MSEKGVVMLQRKEMTTFLVNVISVKMLLTFPKILIMNSGNSAWIELLYNSIVVLLVFLATTMIYRGNKNVIQLAEMFGGKGLKILVGLLVFIVLGINFLSIIRIFPENIKTVLLQDFRIEIIMVVFIIAMGIGAYMGIEALMKINYIFMPIAGMTLLLFVLLLIPYYKIENLLPIFGNGAYGLFVKGFNTVSLFSDILLLNVFLPNCENYGEAKKSGWRALYISITISVVIMLAYGLVYPYPSSKEFMIPVYQLTRVIHLSSFFSRFEAIFQLIWTILILLYSSIYVYSLCYIWQTTFSLKYYRPLIAPIVIICGVLALIPNSVVDLLKMDEVKYIIVYPIAFLLPIIFGFVSRKYYGKTRIDKEEESID